jgi:hypothetical protein
MYTYVVHVPVNTAIFQDKWLMHGFGAGKHREGKSQLWRPLYHNARNDPLFPAGYMYASPQLNALQKSA